MKIQLYVNAMPLTRWLRRLVDRALAPWYVPIEKHERLGKSYARAADFRDHWMAALFETQRKEMPRKDREAWFRERDLVRVNDTLYSGWLLAEIIGPAPLATQDDPIFSAEFRSRA